MQNSCRVFSFMLSFKTHVGTLGWFENCNKLMIGPLFQWLLQLGNNWWVQTICIWFSSSRNCSKIDEIQVCCVLLWTCSQQRTRCLWYLIYKSSIKIDIKELRKRLHGTMINLTTPLMVFVWPASGCQWILFQKIPVLSLSKVHTNGVNGFIQESLKVERIIQLKKNTVWRRNSMMFLLMILRMENMR